MFLELRPTGSQTLYTFRETWLTSSQVKCCASEIVADEESSVIEMLKTLNDDKSNAICIPGNMTKDWSRVLRVSESETDRRVKRYTHFGKND